MTVIDQTLVGNATNAWVNGEAVRASGTFAVVNPATGEPVAEVVDSDAAVIGAAITAAADAFSTWSQTEPSQRAEQLRAWADLIEERTEQVAAITTAESGKLFRDCLLYTSDAADE